MEATLSRRERERLMRRQAMLDAAEHVFAEKGYAHATLDEIAHRAEFGKGTLYNYFEGGKEAILFAIFDDLYDDLCRLIETSFALEKTEGRPFRAVFEDFVESCFAFFLEQQDRFMILIKEVHRMTFSEDQTRATYFQKQRERMVNALVPPLEAAMESGELKSLPAHAVAHMILGNINGYQMHKCIEECQSSYESARLDSPKEGARFITTMLLDGLLTTRDEGA